MADVGIVGENVVVEKNKEVTVAHRLGSPNAAFRWQLTGPGTTTESVTCRESALPPPTPGCFRYLEKNGLRADIHEISGSVEIAPSIGLSDAVCDIVSSGSTLMSNGLKEVEVIFRSEAVLIAGQKLDAGRQGILDKLLFRIKSVQAARNNKYILLNAPNTAIQAITDILPGMKSPTVVPLAEPGWSSVHSVINENDFWNIIDSLREAGARGILVVPIEKMIL